MAYKGNGMTFYDEMEEANHAAVEFQNAVMKEMNKTFSIFAAAPFIAYGSVVTAIVFSVLLGVE